jgi:colanic acid biosynthesis glycosyl transferase WcaI
MKKRIIFLNRFFFPDHSATSQILSDLAFHLSSVGNDVIVITSQQRYEDSRAGLPELESVRGVTIHRVPTTQFGRRDLLGRGVDYASFYCSVWRAVNRIVRAGDILVAKTDPPMLGTLVDRAAKRRNAHLVNWLQDLYPEVATKLGLPLMKAGVGGMLGRVRDASLASARVNVVIGERMASELRALAIPDERIRVIANWCADPAITPYSDGKENALRRAWGLEGKFVFGYSGNLGRAHEFETVLEAARQLQNEPDVVFLIIGGGHNVETLSSRVRELRLSHKFLFQPYQQQAKLNEALNIADLHWISLKPEIEGLIVPSKFYSIAAAGKPMVIIAAPDGELATLVQRHRCGYVIKPGDSAGLVDLLRRLSKDPGDLTTKGHAARTMSVDHFSREQALRKWRNVLQEIVGTHTR